MDTIEANLEQMQMLFDKAVAALRKEKEELRVAREWFELVSVIKLCMYPFFPCW